MPQRPKPLADELVRRPLLRSAALAAGVTDHELRSPLWSRPLRGVYRWAGSDLGPAERIAEVAALLPTGAAIGGWASLWWQGVASVDGHGLAVRRVSVLPRSRAAPPAPRRRPPLEPAPVLVCVGPGARIRPRPDIDLSRRVLPDEDVVVVDGVPVVRAARAVLDLAGRQPPDLGLASLDATLGAGVVTHEDIDSYLAEHRGLYGRPRLLRIASLADRFARSRQESVMRWVWVVEAGLPRPLVNPAICDADGVLLGEPDLLDPDSGTAGEYDGAHHRELRQHTSDNAREERFEDCNLNVVRATSIDLWPRRRGLVQRMRATYRRGLARDRSRDRWYLVRAA